MTKKLLISTVLFALLFVKPCFSQQQAKDSIVRTKKIQYGLFFSSELLPRLKTRYVSYQKSSVGYGPGISLTYNISKNCAINFYNEILNSHLYFETKFTDTLNQYIIEKNSDDLLMLRSNLSFKYSLLSKNIIYYLKVGLENVSVSPVRDSYKYVNMKDSVLYSNDYVYHSALKCLFPIINDGHYINFIGIAVSPGVTILSFKKFQLYSELDMRLIIKY